MVAAAIVAVAIAIVLASEGGREVPNRRTDFKAGRIGCAGGAGARSKRQPGIQLAPAVSPGAAESEEN